MKTGNEASPTAQRKAVRTIGPNGLVSLKIEWREYTTDSGHSREEAFQVYQVGEWHGIGDHRIYGESERSFRHAFENAGIYDENPKPGTRT